MKLRLRSIETKRDNPPRDHSTLDHLKHSLSQSISLNRRDELLSLYPDASLGLTSGDLIFYSLIPQGSAMDEGPRSESLIREGAASTSEAMAEDPRSDSETLIREGNSILDSQPLIEQCNSISETLSCGEGSSFMKVDDELSGVVRKKYSVPFFLRGETGGNKPEILQGQRNADSRVTQIDGIISLDRFFVGEDLNRRRRSEVLSNGEPRGRLL